MSEWFRETLIGLGVALRVVTMLIVAMAFGILVAIKLGDGQPWLAATAVVGFFLLVVLPLRLWWVMRRSRENNSSGAP